MSIIRKAEEYVEFRSNPANDHLSDGEWCGKAELRLAELTAWKAAHPEELEKVLAARRARYADELIKIDAALLAKAKAGDAASIRLAWARFENWSPRIEEEAQKKTGGRVKTFAELISEAS